MFSQALVRFHYYSYVGDTYRALSALLRFERDTVPSVRGEASYHYRRIFQKFVFDNILNSSINKVLDAYSRSREAECYRSQFKSFGLYNLVRIRYPKENEDFNRQGELLVLKPFISRKEKGVLLINYDEGIKKFAAIYDIERLAKYYRFVIEPSTSGYQNPMFFLCFGLDTEVIFQSQYKPDFDYIQKLNHNFFPIRLGAGDWTNVNLFSGDSQEKKIYDLVMIANWLPWKRHRLLFQSIQPIKKHIKRLALIGYPIENAQCSDIAKECEKYGLRAITDFFDRIPHNEVLQIIKKSKVGILLSKEEGANRGIYECFFSDVPVILSKKNRGVNRDHINASTGILADDNELPEAILHMTRNYHRFQPRQWALTNTGFLNATQKLNDFIKNIAIKKGEIWTQDIFQKHNSPHGRYAKPEEQEKANEEFSRLIPFLR
ncbi:MAG: glycosyltransferase [Deltaproteobacteria bacterium]|nr:glycosyltransferase [Deltaproteobacteria bacterium]MBW2152202.1 glycosyltransferase [Deltaproteobacteria bacterium]